MKTEQTITLTPESFEAGKHLEALAQQGGNALTLRLAPGQYTTPISIDRNNSGSGKLTIEATQKGTAIFTGAEPHHDWQIVGARRWRTAFSTEAEHRMPKEFGYLSVPVQVYCGTLRLRLAKSLEDMGERSFYVGDGELWIELSAQDPDPRMGGIEIARRASMIAIERDDVRISGITVTRCASTIQRTGFGVRGHDIEVVDCEFSEAAGGVGAQFRGTRIRIARNNIHHNGQLGFTFDADDSVFEDNWVHNNDLRNFTDDPDSDWNVWESGGGKVVFTRDSVFKGNRFTDNRHGPGLWLDIDNFRNRIENNYFSGNGHSSIMIEISWDNVVCNNIIADTHECNYSAAGILVQLSCRTRIYHNLFLRSEGFGVHLRWHVRPRDIHPYEPADPKAFKETHGFEQSDWMGPEDQYPVKENDVRNNLFVDCRRGAVQIDQHPEYTQDNICDYNLYWNAHNIHPLAGGHALGDWQAMTGLDAHSISDKPMHRGPLFIDQSGQDFRPHPEGPLANTVPLIEECSTDLQGKQRESRTNIGPIHVG